MSHVCFEKPSVFSFHIKLFQWLFASDIGINHLKNENEIYHLTPKYSFFYGKHKMRYFARISKLLFLMTIACSDTIELYSIYSVVI